MIANFFNKTKPVVLFILIICLFIYNVAATILFKVHELSIWFLLERLGVFCCFIVLLLLINFIIQKNNLTKNNSYALLLAVLLLGTFYETLFANTLLFTNIALLLGFRKVYSLRSGKDTKQKLFDAGFWMGISALIYSWSIFYVVLIYVAIFIYQKVDFKNLFIPVIGLLTPIFIYFTYCLYFDMIDVYYAKWVFDASFNFVAYNHFKFLIPIAFLITLLLWSIVTLMPEIIKKGINSKRSWNLILNHLLISVIILVLSPVKNGSEMILIALPATIIIANFLKKSNSTNFKNTILYLILAISIGVYFL